MTDERRDEIREAASLLLAAGHTDEAIIVATLCQNYEVLEGEVRLLRAANKSLAKTK